MPRATGPTRPTTARPAIQGLAVDEFLTDSLHGGVAGRHREPDRHRHHQRHQRRRLHGQRHGRSVGHQARGGHPAASSAAGIPADRLRARQPDRRRRRARLADHLPAGPDGHSPPTTMPTASCTSRSTTARSRRSNGSQANNAQPRGLELQLLDRDRARRRDHRTSTTSPSSCCTTSIPTGGDQLPHAGAGAGRHRLVRPSVARLRAPGRCSSPTTPATPT